MTVFRSIADLNKAQPDHDYPTTVDNLYWYGATEHLACWRDESIPVAEIDTYQLHDDPDDTEGIDKIQSIRRSLRSGVDLPPVVTIHHPKAKWPYYLIEGKHRYNAAYEEETPRMRALVAHLGCCGGPPGDSPEWVPPKHSSPSPADGA